MEWKDLTWFGSGEEQVCMERLDDLKASGVVVNPKRSDLYAAMSLTPLDSVKVAIIGQDPYPKHINCTGVAFSIPIWEKEHPPTLKVILNEYAKDLHYPYPKSGNLEKWCNRGVFLWNAIPTTIDGQSLAHLHWSEWEALTLEIVLELNNRAVPLAFLGSVARKFDLTDGRSPTIHVGHPSPRGNLNARNPFTGSRIFSWFNSHLNEPIDWRLE